MELSKEELLQDIHKQKDCVEEERFFVKKQKQELEAFIEEWHYHSQEEHALLEEVAYLSEGTHSHRHATISLMDQEEETHKSQRLFDNFYEEVEDYEKRLKQKEYALEEEVQDITLRKEVSDDAED